jgi:hypothetical protein
MSEEAYNPIFYYSKACPHSITLLEILASYQNTFPSMRNMDIKQAPPDVLGTPAIRMDNNLYHGDKAFDLIREINEAKNDNMKQTKTPMVSNTNTNTENLENLRPLASESKVSADTKKMQERRKQKQIDLMFGADVIMPRHN